MKFIKYLLLSSPFVVYFTFIAHLFYEGDVRGISLAISDYFINKYGAHNVYSAIIFLFAVALVHYFSNIYFKDKYYSSKEDE